MGYSNLCDGQLSQQPSRPRARGGDRRFVGVMGCTERPQRTGKRGRVLQRLVLPQPTHVGLLHDALVVPLHTYLPTMRARADAELSAYLPTYLPTCKVPTNSGK